jgi:hypothetical protein
MLKETIQGELKTENKYLKRITQKTKNNQLVNMYKTPKRSSVMQWRTWGPADQQQHALVLQALRNDINAKQRDEEGGVGFTEEGH